MSNFTFQLACTKDLPEIMAIYHSLIGTSGCTWSLDYPNAEIASEDIENRRLYILRQDAKIVAVASAGAWGDWDHLPWTPQNPCDLARIGVAPAMQGQGIGTLMLRHIIAEMNRQGFDGMKFVVSKTNPAALALYDKNGFERCGETVAFGIDWYCYQMVF